MIAAPGLLMAESGVRLVKGASDDLSLGRIIAYQFLQGLLVTLFKLV